MVAGRLALAIPSNDVRRFLQGQTGKNWLGVTLTPLRLPSASRQEIGLLVLGIEPSGPAPFASPLPGDILLGSEKKTFCYPADFPQPLEENSARFVVPPFASGG